MESKLLNGNNIELLRELEENSVDSIVTDPPYGLSFMNKKWDYDVPSIEFWTEAFRVLKPGGHVLSFGGTRTYHRMVVNMEDAGFEIRDQIQWIYGSGFPKSHNIGKAYDKKMGNDRDVVGTEKQNNFDKYDASMMTKENRDSETTLYKELEITKGQSPYEGWGTALKPANEPICLGRKPFKGTVVNNVIKWETGGINIDECRVGTETISIHNAPKGTFAGGEPDRGSDTSSYRDSEGRFPANVILECICDEVIKGKKGEPIVRDKKGGSPIFGSELSVDYQGKWYGDKGDIHTNPNCPCRLLDEQSGVSKGYNRIAKPGGKTFGGADMSEDVVGKWFGDKGGASRFFYQSKVSKKERNMGIENNHPTIKPVSLMSYLCRLITPKGGVVLDPFMGSGSTGISALLEDFNFIGMEMDEEYFKIAEKRINNYEDYRELVKK